MNKTHENLDHLNKEEVEVFYEDYLNLKASDIVKKYNLADKLSKRLHAIIPKRITSLNCEKCGKVLYADWLTKSEVNDFSSNHSKCSCGHINVISDELDSFIIDGNIQCDCKYCKSNEKINKKIILEEKLGRPSIPLPFTDTNNTVSLSDISYLMGLIYARWKEDESFINPPRSNGIKIYPDIPSNEDVKNPLLKCLRNDVLLIDLENSDLDLINILENGSVNYFYTQVHLIPNLKKDDDFELASVKEVFEWLSRKFTDGYWQSDWSDELKDVWIDLGVCECIEYAKIKSNEYKFHFDEEQKFTELIRGILNNHSISECFYFISSAYWSAAAFLQSDKCKGYNHAKNTILNKIISLSDANETKQWDWPNVMERSAFRIMLFNIMLNSKGDEAFYMKPSDYGQLLNRVNVFWPEKLNEVSIQDKDSFIDFVGEMVTHFDRFTESKGSLDHQMAYITGIAYTLGLNKACEHLRDNVLNEKQTKYMLSILKK